MREREVDLKIVGDKERTIILSKYLVAEGDGR